MTVAVVLLLAAVILLTVAVRIPRRPGGYRSPVGYMPTAAVRPARRPVRADIPHVLYKYPHLYRPGARYYGISNEPAARDRRHSRDPKDQWWYQTSTKQMVIIAEYPNRAAAQAAEREAVRAAWARGEDIANTHHVPRSTAPKRRKSRAARR